MSNIIIWVGIGVDSQLRSIRERISKLEQEFSLVYTIAYHSKTEYNTVSNKSEFCKRKEALNEPRES